MAKGKEFPRLAPGIPRLWFEREKNIMSGP